MEQLKPTFPLKQKNPETVLQENLDNPRNNDLLVRIAGSMSELLELKPILEAILEDKHASIEKEKLEILDCLNTVRTDFNALKEKLDCEVDYTRELTTQIQNYEYKKNNAMLQNSLIVTENKINNFTKTITEFVEEKITAIEETVSNLQTVEDAVDQSIARFNKIASSNAENEYNALKKQSEDLLKSFTRKCQEDMEIMKKKSLDFLKECEKENKEIISKIPKVNNNKYSMKDYLLFGICAITILFQVYMMIH